MEDGGIGEASAAASFSIPVVVASPGGGGLVNVQNAPQEIISPGSSSFFSVPAIQKIQPKEVIFKPIGKVIKSRQTINKKINAIYSKSFFSIEGTLPM